MTEIKLRFNNLADLPKPEKNQEYIYNFNGWDYIECFSSYRDVTGARRKPWMYSSINNLICLNPSISLSQTLEIALNANIKKVKPRLSKMEVGRMLDALHFKNSDQELEANYSKRKKKIIFNAHMDLSGSRRKILALQANIEIKRDKKIQDLYDIIEGWNFDRDGKITQRGIIALKSGVGKKAVEKYYRVFWAFINKQNQENQLSSN